MSMGQEPSVGAVSAGPLVPDGTREGFRAVTGLDLAVVTAGDTCFTLGTAGEWEFSQAEVETLLAATGDGEVREVAFTRAGEDFLACRLSRVSVLLAGPVNFRRAGGDWQTALCAVDDLPDLPSELEPVLQVLRLVARPLRDRVEQDVRARRLLSQITVVNAIGEMLSREPDLGKAVQVILETAGVLLDAESGSVMLFSAEDPEVLRIAYAVGLPADVIRDVRVRLGEGVSGSVARSGEPALMRRGERHRLSVLPKAQWDTALCVPLRAKDRVLGVLNIRSANPEREFDLDDLQLAITFASQAALAIDNTRLLRRLTERLEDAQSELVETNHVLLEIRARLENILRSIPAPVLVAGHDGRLLLLNAAAERALGVAKELALHKPLRAVLQESEVGRALTEAVLGDGDVLPPGLTEVSVGVPARKNLQVHVASLEGPDGSPAGSVVVIADVTEIQELADLKSELVSITSHEIKTPITAINLAARTLESAMEALEPEERAEIVQIIVNQSVRLKNLVTNLLDLSKIEAGRALDVDRAETDVGAMLRSAIEAVEQGFSTRGHTFAVDVLPGAGRVAMDRSKIEQVVVNFLTNAVKYSEPGPVELTARTHGAGWVRIEVRDHGKGIRAEELPSVFERFQRVGGREHRRKSGHGLGLHLCKGLVEAHGGRIGAESTPGEGSMFYFALPVESATSPREPNA